MPQKCNPCVRYEMLPMSQEGHLAGGLVDMARMMGKEAIKAHRTGIVSLHELNQKLVGK